MAKIHVILKKFINISMMKSMGFNSKVIIFVVMVIFLSGYIWIQRMARYHSEFSDFIYNGFQDESGPLGSDSDNRQITSSVEKLAETVMGASLIKMPKLKSSSSSYLNNSDHNLTVIIHTTLNHFERRQIIRNTWGGWLRDNGQQVFFIIGTSNRSSSVDQFRHEHQLYGDLIEYDFVDSYRNLTLKTLLTLRFFNEKILKLHTKGKQVEWKLKLTSSLPESILRRTQYLLKTDDDVVYYPQNLLRWRDYVPQEMIGTPNETRYYRGLIVGNVATHSRPFRNDEKYGVSEEMYSGKMYPNFVSGTGYMMSADVARSLFITAMIAKRCQFLPLEDVFLTGVCATRSVKMIDPYTYSRDEFLDARLINHPGFIVQELNRGFKLCKFNTPYLIKLSHGLNPAMMRSVWKKLNSSEDNIESECGQKTGSSEGFRAYPLQHSFIS